MSNFRFYHNDGVRNVCIPDAGTVSEIEKLLATAFSTGNRQVVGVENVEEKICVPLSVICRCPGVLEPAKSASPPSYKLLLKSTAGDKDDEVEEDGDETSNLIQVLLENGLNPELKDRICDMLQQEEPLIAQARDFCFADQDINQMVAMFETLAGLEDESLGSIVEMSDAITLLCQQQSLTFQQGSMLQRLLFLTDSDVIKAFLLFESDSDSDELVDNLRAIADVVIDSISTDSEEEENTANDFLVNFVDVLIEEHMVTDDEAEQLMELIEQGNETVHAALQQYEQDKDHGDLAVALISLIRHKSGKLFQDALLELTEQKQINMKDAAWLRGRRAAEDEWLCDQVTDAEDTENFEELKMGLLVASKHFSKVRRELGFDLTQLVEEMEGMLDPAQTNTLRQMVENDNEVVLSAYEVFAVDLHEQELRETLMMAVQQPSTPAENDEPSVEPGDSTERQQEVGDVEFAFKALGSLVKDGDLEDEIAKRLLEMAMKGHDNILAALDVYRKTNDRTDFLDTVQLIIERDDWTHEGEIDMFQTIRELCISLVQTNSMTEHQARTVLIAVCGQENDELADAWTEFQSDKNINALEKRILKIAHGTTTDTMKEMLEGKSTSEETSVTSTDGEQTGTDEDSDDDEDTRNQVVKITDAGVEKILANYVPQEEHQRFKSILEEPGQHLSDVLVAAFLAFQHTHDADDLNDTLEHIRKLSSSTVASHGVQETV